MKAHTFFKNRVFNLKYYLWIFSFLCMSINLSGQPTGEYHVIGFGGAQSDAGRSVCTDQSGNVYLTGYFQGTAYFGAVKLMSKGDTDIFLAKLDRFGNLVWIRQFGSIVRKNLIATEMGNVVKIDKKGNVYLAGIFSLSAVFGDTTLNSFGGDDIFVAKLNTYGKIIWAKNYGSIAHDVVYDIAIDNTGNIMLSGIFGTKPSNIAFNISKKGSFAILARIDKAGNMKLIRSVNGTGYVEGKSVAIDKDNNIYWGLNFEGEVNLKDKKIHSNGNSDILLEKISPSDNSLWCKQIGGRYNDKINSMTITNGNELLFTGSFEDEILIDQRKIVSNGSSDFLICQFNETGKLVWIEKYGGKLSDHGISVSSLPNGNIIVGGIFQDIVKTSIDTLVSSGFYDIVITCYDKNHRLFWEKQLGNEYGYFLKSVAVGSNNAYFTGNFRGILNVNFDEISSKGSDDIFLITLPLSFLDESASSGNLSNKTDTPTIKISPNPSAGIFHISSNFAPINVNLIVKDVSERNLMSFENIELPAEINLSTLSNGPYFFYIYFKDRKFIKKVILTK